VAAFHCLGVLGGSEMVVDGTACAAASFGAMVTMWNDARLRHGLPSLGFLNPELCVTLSAGCCTPAVVEAP